MNWLKGATPWFKASELNYFGNVEGKEVIGGKVDVAVTDGFTRKCDAEIIGGGGQVDR